MDGKNIDYMAQMRVESVRLVIFVKLIKRVRWFKRVIWVRWVKCVIWFRRFKEGQISH